MRKGHKRIYYEIYPYGLWVFYKMSTKEIYEILDAELPEEAPRDEINNCYRADAMEARFYMFSSGQSVINFQECDMGLVAHESFHATHAIMKRVGIRLSFKSDEAFAYMLGYIVDKICDMFNELSKPKKK